jgi:hypothetical protein
MARRPYIHTICRCSTHAIPLPMHFAGRHIRFGRRVYVMFCPVSGIERHYIYRYGRIIRVY